MIGSSWAYQLDITGASGSRGSLWYTGVGSTSIYESGQQNLDFYLDTSTNNYFQLISGLWFELGNITGWNPSTTSAILPPLWYNSTTSTLSIYQASSSTNGYLSSSDWTSFNTGGQIASIPTPIMTNYYGYIPNSIVEYVKTIVQFNTSIGTGIFAPNYEWEVSLDSTSWSASTWAYEATPYLTPSSTSIFLRLRFNYPTGLTSSWYYYTGDGVSCTTSTPGVRIPYTAPNSTAVTGVLTNTGTALNPIIGLNVFGASGTSHATGAVPDPGSTSGSVRYLREDATWGVPAGSALTNPMTTVGDLIIGGAFGAPTRLGVGSTSQVLTVVSGAPAWTAGFTPGSVAAPSSISISNSTYDASGNMSASMTALFTDAAYNGAAVMTDWAYAASSSSTPTGNPWSGGTGWTTVAGIIGSTFQLPGFASGTQYIACRSYSLGSSTPSSPVYYGGGSAPGTGIAFVAGGGSGSVADTEVVLNGTYSLTNTYATVQPSGGAPWGYTLTVGSWNIQVIIEVTAGSTANDVYWGQLYNATALSALNYSQESISNIPASGVGQIVINCSFTLSTTSQIVVQAYNATAARGTIS